MLVDYAFILASCFIIFEQSLEWVSSLIWSWKFGSSCGRAEVVPCHETPKINLQKWFYLFVKHSKTLGLSDTSLDELRELKVDVLGL